MHIIQNSIITLSLYVYLWVCMYLAFLYVLTMGPKQENFAYKIRDFSLTAKQN